MSDVFISYSRLDREFVGQLREALVAKAQEVWIDWEAIPPSQAWWDEIKKGIARANNFVVVLSPNSMASPICHLEIAYARQLNKRIIPVLHTNYDRDDSIVAITRRLAKKEEFNTRNVWGNNQPHDLFDANDGELKHINFFFFGPDDDFAKRFTELLEIIRTDYAHKEQHTTLELRALEWDRRGRDASFLLLDTELIGAQMWLAAATDKKPEPTELQYSYIRASALRTRQLRNIRRASIIGSLVAIIAILFAIGAVFIGIDARDNANAANTEAVLANQAVADANTFVAEVTHVPATLEVAQNLVMSLQLAARAQQTFPGDELFTLSQSTLALRLVYEASQIDPIPQVERVLAELAFAPGVRPDTFGTVAGASRIVFAPDSQAFLRTACAEQNQDNLCVRGEVIIWNADSQEPSRRITAHAGRPTSVVFAPDGNTWFSAGCAQISTDDPTICDHGEVIQWDYRSGEPINRYTIAEGAASGLFLTSDGSRFIIHASNGGQTERIRWNIVTGEIEARHIMPDRDTRSAIATMPDGLRYATGSCTQRDDRDLLCIESVITLRDGDTGDALREYTGHEESTISLHFSPDGRWLMANGLNLWDVETGEKLPPFPGISETTGTVQFSPDGQIIASGDANGIVTFWDADAHEVIRRYRGFAGQVTSISFSPNGRYLMISGRDGPSSSFSSVSVIWDLSNPQIVQHFDGHTDDVNAVAFSPNGTMIASGDAAGHIIIWDAQTGAMLGNYAVHEGEVTDLAFDSTGERLIVGGGGWLLDSEWTLIDVTTGDVLRYFSDSASTSTIREPSITGVDFAPDGMTFIASYTTTGLVSEALIWDANTGETVGRIPSGFNITSSITISPDGESVAITTTDETLTLYDINGRALKRFAAHTDGLLSVAFSNDGQRLVTGSRDTTIIVWDIASGELIRRYEGHTDGVNSVTFAPGGQRIVSGSDDGTVIIWDVATGEILRRYDNHNGAVSEVAFAPDGQTVISASADGTLFRWRYDDIKQLQDWVVQHRQLAELTCDQRLFLGLPDERQCGQNDLPTATSGPTIRPVPSGTWRPYVTQSPFGLPISTMLATLSAPRTLEPVLPDR